VKNPGESETWAERAGSLPRLHVMVSHEGSAYVRTILGPHCCKGDPIIDITCALASCLFPIDFYLRNQTRRERDPERIWEEGRGFSQSTLPVPLLTLPALINSSIFVENQTVRPDVDEYCMAVFI